MVYSCSVLNCRGNQRNGPKVSVFAFPTDEDMRNKWIQAIRRNFIPTKNSRVCELHFCSTYIEREVVCYDSKTGKVLRAPLIRPRLKALAIPTIFESRLEHPSTEPSQKRAEGKRSRKKRKHLPEAITERVQIELDSNSKKCFYNLDSFIKCLDENGVRDNWTVIKRCDLVLIVYIENCPAPYVKYSVKIDKNLFVSIYYEKEEMFKLGDVKFPLVCNNIDDFDNYLCDLEVVDSNINMLDCKLELILKLLSNLSSDKEPKIEFICEQISLFVNSSKFLNRYSMEALVHYSLLYTISPHAYKYLKKTNFISLPHPNTLNGVCQNINTNPAAEQSDDNFLGHIEQKKKHLNAEDCIVSLMINEIYIKPYLDCKGENVGFNTSELATSAHVFMIQSLKSSYKDVVHIKPVKTINALELFSCIKKIVIGLHSIGFNVVCIVSDNNSIHRKAVSYFNSPPSLSIVYNNPCNREPLFYLMDTVHIIKSIRNNWISRKNNNIVFRDFDNFSDCKVASFNVVRDLYKLEKNQLVKRAYTLNLKSVNPSSIEKQNVECVLNIFNEHVSEALLHFGNDCSMINAGSTGEFIKIINDWWEIVNVTINKNIRSNDELQQPLEMNAINYEYLKKFLDWLDNWNLMSTNENRLTKETHLALSHTTHCITELVRYCKKSLDMDFILPGKLQTEGLEARFGNYRTMGGSNHHISLREICEMESKFRIQNILPLKLASNAFGNIPICNYDVQEIMNEDECSENLDELDSGLCQVESSGIELEYMEEDYECVEKCLPFLIYVSGYCVTSVLKKINCEDCKNAICLDKELAIGSDEYSIISNLDGGKLNYPHPDIVNVVIQNYTTINKLVSKDLELKFLKCNNKKKLALGLSCKIVLEKNMFFDDFLCTEHNSNKILIHVLGSSTNLFLKEYVKKTEQNVTSRKRKINTLN